MSDRRRSALVISPVRVVVVTTWLIAAIALLVITGAEAMVLLLIGLGFGAAFLSGLVGVGGAVVLIPLLLYVPPLLGLEALGIKSIAGITIVQVVAGAVSAATGHRAGGHVDRRLVVTLGPTMIVASFVGAYLSAFVAPIVLEAVFAGLAVFAAAMMLGLRNRAPQHAETPPVFDRRLAIVIGLVVGVLAGLIGAGGAFFLAPVLLHVLRIPMRYVVGSSVGIVAISAGAGLLGKAVTGQVDWLLAAALVVGALPGGRAGATVSRRTTPYRLSIALGVVILIVAVRMWLDILGRIG
ncbi:MAG TPA: sulfite exporter TauE/SafE family protein [Candidatus Limnocylindrales bacterium]|nr:sulfite exporter TauE/SafE family protein [Candidatus Limnocylindrales bacterium]